MPDIEIQYDNFEVIPEPYRDLYEEKDGKFQLTKVNGMKTITDVNNVQEALRKERNDHAQARESLRSWSSLGKKPEEIVSILDKLPELEAAANGKLDDSKIQTIVESRLQQKVAPLERSFKELSDKATNLEKERDLFRQQIERRDMSDVVRAAATEMKVIPTALADIEMVAQNYMERDESGNFVTRTGIPGVTPGLDAKAFLKDMQKSRPHWWPESQGGGAGGGGGGNGGGGENPWSANSWNLTEQGRVIKELGPARAEEMAKRAGSFVGATAPAKKK